MNILIRPLTLDDAVVSYKWRNDPEIWKFTSSRPTIEITEKIERDWVESTLTDRTKSRFAILTDNVYVGNVQLTDIVPSQTAEFHIFLGEKSFWGKGVAKEATYQILTYAKEVLNLNSVFLDVKKENLPAIKSYEKNGFVIIKEEDEIIRMVCDIKRLEPPMVSIFCMVYNHENFISQALDGFLMQKTSFSSVIVLGEDCSTDDSREIILEYAEKYPGKFKLLLNDKNIGAHKNQELVLENCKGKYIAMCEGDDYWTDPLKLQKQVDFMEANPDYGICFHEAAISWSEKKETHQIQLNSQFPWNRMSIDKDIYDISDVLNGPFMATASVLYRNPYINNFPIWFSKAASGDITLYAIIIGDKKIKFINEIMCVYRRHPGGITKLHKGNGIILNRLQTLKHINEYYDNKYVHIIRFSVSDYIGAIKSLNFQEYVLLLRLFITSTIVEKKHIVSFLKKGLKKIL